MQNIPAIVDVLNLDLHPEGGFYKEVHRSRTRVKNLIDSSDRSAYTSIYYLLPGGDFSAWHRIKSDETWYFHCGCDVLIYFFDQNKLLRTVQVGMTSKNLQATIPAHTWFAAKPLNEDDFSLVSCAVAPGFEFADFEIAKREALIKEFGTSAKNIQLIQRFTRV